MRRDKARAFMSRSNGSLLGSQDQLIKLALGSAELAVGWESARDVTGVTIEFTTRVNQNQVAIEDGAGIGSVMQHTSVAAARNDGAISGVLRTVLAKFVQQFSIKMIFTNVFASAQHRR